MFKILGKWERFKMAVEMCSRYTRKNLLEQGPGGIVD